MHLDSRITSHHDSLNYTTQPPQARPTPNETADHASQSRRTGCPVFPEFAYHYLFVILRSLRIRQHGTQEEIESEVTSLALHSPQARIGHELTAGCQAQRCADLARVT